MYRSQSKLNPYCILTSDRECSICVIPNTSSKLVTPAAEVLVHTPRMEVRPFGQALFWVGAPCAQLLVWLGLPMLLSS